MNSRPRRPDVRQEVDNPPWRRVLLIVLAVIVILMLLGIWSTAILRERQEALRPSGRFPEQDLGPRRKVGVEERLFQERGITGEEGRGQALTRRKLEELSRFGWVDQDRGLVRIPIEDAMRLVAEEGQR